MSSYCNVCRICLSVCGEFMDIFDFAPAIMECAPISIIPGDGFPSVICDVCLDKLQAAQHFRVLCIQSDIILRQSDKEVTIGIPTSNDEDYDNCSNIQDDDDLQSNTKSFEHFMTVDIQVENDVSFDCDTLEKLPQSQIYQSRIIKNEADTVLASSNSNLKQSEEEGNINNHDTSKSPIPSANNKNSVKCKYKSTNNCTENQTEPIVKKEPLDLICKKCKQHFTNVVHFRRHKTQCYKVQKNKCACCNKIFKSKALYVKHFTSKKCTPTKLCKICLKSFQTKLALTLHYQLHKIKKNFYNCHKCSKQFQTRSQFLKHRQQSCKIGKRKNNKKKK